MLFPKLELHLRATRPLTRILNRPCRHTWATEVHTHVGPHIRLQPRQIRTIQNPIPHPAKQPREIGPPKVRARFELRQRINRGANTVEHDVLRRVEIQLLRQVGVDAEELLAAAGEPGGFEALLF